MFNLLFPSFNAIDAFLDNWVPFWTQLLAWGGLSGIVSILVFSLVSNQQSIVQRKKEIKELRAKLFKPDVSDLEHRILIKRNVTLSFGLLRVVIIPALISALPVVVVVLWLSAYHSFEIRNGDEARIRVEIVPEDASFKIQPAGILSVDASGAWFLSHAKGTHLRIRDEKGLVYTWRSDVPLVHTVHKKLWWNILLGNEAGYIRSDAEIQEIRFDYSRKVIVSGMPEWAATWEFIYFVSVFVFALAAKIILRVH